MPDLLWRPEQPVVHRVEYSTDIQLAADGNETRSARLEVPRQSVDYRLFLDELLEVRRYRKYLFQDLAALWRIPLWWEPEVITVETGAATALLKGDFALTDLTSSDTIVLVHPTGSPTHISALTTVTPSVITMTTPVTPAFPKGSQFFLLQDARIRGAPQLQRFRAGQEVLAVTFDFDRATALGGAGATVATFQHSADSAPFSLLDRKPIADSLVPYSFDASNERVDFGKRYTQFAGFDPAAIMERRRYAIDTRAELQYWEKFLETVVGAREPLYTPTYRPDLVINTQPSTPWTTVIVKDEGDPASGNFDYATQYFPHSSHKQLRFATDKGEQYREVSTAVDNGDGTVTLALASALTANSVISQISFLERSRLEDVASFEHKGNRSFVQIGLKLIQRHPDE